MSVDVAPVESVRGFALRTLVRLVKLFGSDPFTYTELRENVVAPPAFVRRVIRWLIREGYVEPVGSFPIAEAAKRFPELAARRRWRPDVIARNDIIVDVYVLTPKALSMFK